MSEIKVDHKLSNLHVYGETELCGSPYGVTDFRGKHVLVYNSDGAPVERGKVSAVRVTSVSEQCIIAEIC